MEAEEAFEVETLQFAGRPHCILRDKPLVQWSTTACRRNTSVELSACSQRLPNVKPSALRLCRKIRICLLVVPSNER
jgi:hypothetical protein